MRIIISVPAKSSLEGGAWTDGYDYQNKDKKHYHYEKLESIIFSVQSIIAQPMWFPTLLLLPSSTTSWIINNAENNPNIPLKFPKYKRC